MDLATPGTRETPRRLLQALVDATAGYDGDPKLRTTFPSERPHGVSGARSQIVEGPIAFHALCEHHALPFHGVAHVAYVAGPRDPRDLEADAARAPLRAPLHRAGAARRADRGHAGRARRSRAASPCTCEAAHLCTQMRGVAEDGSRTVTTFWRGLYEQDAELRARVPRRGPEPRLTPLAGPRTSSPACPSSTCPRSCAGCTAAGSASARPASFANFVQTIDGVVAIPDLRALELA